MKQEGSKQALYFSAFPKILTFFSLVMGSALCLLLAACNIQQEDIEKAAGDNLFKTIVAPTPLQIIPNFKQIYVNTEFQFSASGGNPPYTYSLASGPGSTSSKGLYLSPASSPGSAVIRVTDALGKTSDALITVDEELVISPATKKLNISSNFQFVVTGGNPPYNYLIASGAGSISNTGLFTSAATAGTTIVRAIDNHGTIVNSTVTVGNGPVISPSYKKIAVSNTIAFSSSSGSAPFTWEVSQGSGSINAVGSFTGAATQGSATVRVTDAAGYSSEAVVETFIPHKIRVGKYNTCALTGDSKDVKCWGFNQYSNLGHHGSVIGDEPSDMGDNLNSVILGTDFNPVDVISGGGFHCARSDANLVQCWGYSGHYQNGFDNRASSIAANSMGDNIPFLPIGSNRTIVQMAGGNYNNCAVLDDGSVKCWGYSLYGGSGQDAVNTYYYNNLLFNLPPINLGQAATKVVAGSYFSCALLADQSIKCWGLGTSGQLGIDEALSRGDDPGEMAALPAVILGSTAIDISAGAAHACAILSNGNVKCWGQNGYGQLGQDSITQLGDAPGEMATINEINFGVGKTAVKIFSGGYHNCVLLNDASIRCWGNNDQGQLGYGDNVRRGDNPGEMASLTAVTLGTGRTVVDMNLGNLETCAILDDGNLKCWGYNLSGQLGLGHLNNVGTNPSDMGDSLPNVNLGSNVTVLKISRSFWSTRCALVLKDGVNQVICWGQNLYGDSGDMMSSWGIRSSDMGSNLPALDFGSLTGQVQNIYKNYYGFCAQFIDGNAKCWGYNTSTYRLCGANSADDYVGDKSIDMGDALAYLNAGIGIKPLQIESSEIGTFVCAVFDDQTTKCWGLNNYGQLGQDNVANYNYLPTTAPINLGVGRYATKVTTGAYHACAKLDDNSIKCWGSNAYGELGAPDADPVEVNRRKGNEPGEMALITAVNLGTGRSAKDVCSAYYTSCAHLDNDQVKCWGYNGYGQLGQEDTANRGLGAGEMGDALLPINLGTGRTVKKISCGVNYNCALLDNDKVKCWGYNGYGNLGQGHVAVKGSLGASMGDNLTYVDLGTGRTAVDIQAGFYHTCALLDNNDIKCWGWNNYGQLGQGHGNNLGDNPNEMGDNLLPIRLQ